MAVAVKRVEVFEGRDGQWYWRAVAGNGEIVSASEGYVSKWNAKRGARRLFPRARLTDAN